LPGEVITKDAVGHGLTTVTVYSTAVVAAQVELLEADVVTL